MVPKRIRQEGKFWSDAGVDCGAQEDKVGGEKFRLGRQEACWVPFVGHSQRAGERAVEVANFGLTRWVRCVGGRMQHLHCSVLARWGPYVSNRNSIITKSNTFLGY